jgi:hypothetical protein
MLLTTISPEVIPPSFLRENIAWSSSHNIEREN